MATGKLTYDALRTKTLKVRIKTQRKIVRHSNSTSIGTTAVKPNLSICPVGLVWLARYCGKMYSRHLFSCSGYGGSSCKRPPHVSDHPGLTFWEVAYFTRCSAVYRPKWPPHRLCLDTTLKRDVIFHRFRSPYCKICSVKY